MDFLSFRLCDDSHTLFFPHSRSLIVLSATINYLSFLVSDCWNSFSSSPRCYVVTFGHCTHAERQYLVWESTYKHSEMWEKLRKNENWMAQIEMNCLSSDKMWCDEREWEKCTTTTDLMWPMMINIIVWRWKPAKYRTKLSLSEIQKREIEDIFPSCMIWLKVTPMLCYWTRFTFDFRMMWYLYHLSWHMMLLIVDIDHLALGKSLLTLAVIKRTEIGVLCYAGWAECGVCGRTEKFHEPLTLTHPLKSALLPMFAATEAERT